MRKVDPLASNTLMLIANEHVRQLEKQDPRLNVIRKQVEMRERMEEIIYLARTAPKGRIDVVFASQDYPPRTQPSKIIDEARQIVSFFNVSPSSRKGVMMRTVFVINVMWSDHIKAYQVQYGFSDLNLKPYEKVLDEA